MTPSYLNPTRRTRPREVARPYRIWRGRTRILPAAGVLAVNARLVGSGSGPVANPDSYPVERNNEYDTDASTGVLANDTDSNGDPLTATLATGPSHGSLTLYDDGSFSYMPAQNFTGTDSFTYTAGDGTLTSSPATVTLTVTSTPPSAADQTLDVLQNTTLNALPGTLLLDDSNPDNMTLTAQDVTQPTNGSVTVNADGSFVYTPSSGFTGTDSFTFDLSDGVLTSTPATVTITVKPTNTAPTAGPLSYSVDENSSLSTDSTSGVLTGAADADGDTLFAALVTKPSNGTLTLGVDGSFTYTPNSNFYGTDSFQYKAFDGTTYSSAATVTLNVAEDVPTAVNDSYSVLPTGTTSIAAANGVLANDSDPDGAPLTAVLQTPPTNGSVTLNSDGSFEYTPNSNFTGSDSFTYEAYNGTNYSPAATVTLASGPVAVAQSYSVNHDTPLTMDDLLSGASDADGDTLTAALATGPSNGTVTVNSDGSFTYTPATHYVGTDSFTFTVSDGTQTSAPATATIDVTDNPPSAGDDSYSVLHDQTLTVPASAGVLNNDSDPDGDSLTAQLVSGPSDGTLQFGSDGSFVYTPNAHFAGTDSFTYEANDGVMNSSPATVFVYVTDAAPVAANENYSTPAGQTLTVAASGVLASDFDPDGDPLTAQVVTGPTSGTLTLNNDGSFNYTPQAGFSGNDSFTYQVSDGILASNTATATITVTTPNSPVPVANDDEYATGMNQPLTIAGPGVLANDTAPVGQTLTAELYSGPAHGALTLNADGSFTYTPAAGFTGDDSFAYEASAGGVLSDTPATVTIHVADVTLGMPQGPWVPINANDNNGSAWQANSNDMIPQTPDYNYLKPLPDGRADPQLQPLNIAVNNPSPFGFVTLSVQSVPGATGQIRLWADQQKTKQILPGVYPAVGPDALPATIYVEGVNPTSRTITDGVIQSPVPDNTITATYSLLLPSIPGGNGPGNVPTLVPLWKAQVQVGVAPVVQFFSINNQPTPPNPPVNPGTAGQIGFLDAPNGLNRNTIYGGYYTFGVNPANNRPVLGQAAATINAQVFNANVPGAPHFIQNESITNGGGGARNAWTFAAGGPAAQNWAWLVGGNMEAASDRVLDMFGGQQPSPPYYQSQGIPAGANLVQIQAGDSPRADGATLVKSGLAGNNMAGAPVTQVAWTFNFTDFLAWSMPAGVGAPPQPPAAGGNVIYTLATNVWQVVFQATANPANGWANTIAPASGVIVPGDFTLYNSPTPRLSKKPVVIGPTANQAAIIR